MPTSCNPYLEAWDERQASAVARRQELAAAARARAPVLAARCRAAGASRVRLFGSLVTGNLGATPDIDLAIEGVAPEAWLALAAELDHLAAPFEVDPVFYESAPAPLRAAVEHHGVEL